MNGAVLCRLLLEEEGVECEVARGTCNAYYPGDGLITLRRECYQGSSAKHLTLAAHEAGHAVQHRDIGWMAPPLRWLLPGRLWLEWDASCRARGMLRSRGCTVHEGALRESWEEYLIPALWQVGVMLGVLGWALVWRR